jgi:hypothetical protein
LARDANCVDDRVQAVMDAGGNPFNELGAAKRENPMAYVTAPLYVEALSRLWDQAWRFVIEKAVELEKKPDGDGA